MDDAKFGARRTTKETDALMGGESNVMGTASYEHREDLEIVGWID